MTDERRTLARDLGVAILALVGLTVYELVVLYTPFGHPSAAADAMGGLAGSVAAVSSMLVAWFLVRRGRVAMSAWMLAVAFTVVNFILAGTVPSYAIFVPVVPIIGVALIAPYVGLTALARFAIVAWVTAIVATLVTGLQSGSRLGADWAGWGAGTAIIDFLAMLFVVRAETHRRRLLATAQAANAELRSTVDELESSRANWRTLVEATPTPLWAFDPATLRFILVNQAAVDVYGWSREEFLAKSLDSVWAPGQDDQTAEQVRLARAGSRTFGRVRHLRRDGSAIEVQYEGRTIEYEGRPIRINVLADVTDLVRLQDERARLLDQSADFILTLDPAGRIREANRALAALATPGQDVTGADVGEFVRPEDHAPFAAAFAAALAETRTVEVEAAVRDAAGSVTLVSWRLVGDRASGLVWAFGRDVTAARGLEEQLHRSERMRVVGQLAGGVAHDFNNLLTAIGGHAELALEELPDDSRVRADLETIRATAARASTLTRQLLAFGRKAPNQPVATSFDTVVDGVAPLLRRLIGEHITVQIHHGRSVPILADPGGLDQVLLNLVVNARDAMPGGGTLLIETNVVVAPDLFGQVREHALLRVTDSGTGMEPEVLARAFEPFYTTKPVGSGVGLGLASAEGFVGMAGGRIEVSSSVGAGTVFRVLIPRAASVVEAAGSDSGTGEHAASPGGVAATILVVEDEESIRALARRFLGRAGHRVLEAVDVDEAERIAGASGQIDLLLTDLVMPGGSGRQLAVRLRAARPDLKVILMSGYERGSAETEEIEGAAFLAKPWAGSALLGLVAEVLAGEQPAELPSAGLGDEASP
jgi:PAS domain S-box-containing protein